MPDSFDSMVKLLESVHGVGDGIAVLAVAAFWVGLVWVAAQIIQTAIVKWL